MNQYYEVFESLIKTVQNDPASQAASLAKAYAFILSIEPRLTKSKWLIGENITMIDFWVGAFACDQVVNPNHTEKDEEKWAEILNKCPNFRRYIDDFKIENAVWLGERG